MAAITRIVSVADTAVLGMSRSAPCSVFPEGCCPRCLGIFPVTATLSRERARAGAGGMFVFRGSAGVFVVSFSPLVCHTPKPKPLLVLRGNVCRVHFEVSRVTHLFCQLPLLFRTEYGAHSGLICRHHRQTRSIRSRILVAPCRARVESCLLRPKQLERARTGELDRSRQPMPGQATCRM